MADTHLVECASCGLAVSPRRFTNSQLQRRTKPCCISCVFGVDVMPESCFADENIPSHTGQRAATTRSHPGDVDRPGDESSGQTDTRLQIDDARAVDSEEEDVAASRRKESWAFAPTRRELRSAFESHRVPFEHVLKDIRYKPALAERHSEFLVLVEDARAPRLCRQWCWTGRCDRAEDPQRRGTACKYAHPVDIRLRCPRVAAPSGGSMPAVASVALPEWLEALDEVTDRTRREEHVHGALFLLRHRVVVWGRELPAEATNLADEAPALGTSATASATWEDLPGLLWAKVLSWLQLRKVVSLRPALLSGRALRHGPFAEAALWEALTLHHFNAVSSEAAVNQGDAVEWGVASAYRGASHFVALAHAQWTASILLSAACRQRGYTPHGSPSASPAISAEHNSPNGPDSPMLRSLAAAVGEREAMPYSDSTWRRVSSLQGLAGDILRYDDRLFLAAAGREVRVLARDGLGKVGQIRARKHVRALDFHDDRAVAGGVDGMLEWQDLCCSSSSLQAPLRQLTLKQWCPAREAPSDDSIEFSGLHCSIDGALTFVGIRGTGTAATVDNETGRVLTSTVSRAGFPITAFRRIDGASAVLAAPSGAVAIWDARQPALIARTPAPSWVGIPRRFCLGEPTCAAVATDGTTIVVGFSGWRGVLVSDTRAMQQPSPLLPGPEPFRLDAISEEASVHVAVEKLCVASWHVADGTTQASVWTTSNQLWGTIAQDATEVVAVAEGTGSRLWAVGICNQGLTEVCVGGACLTRARPTRTARRNVQRGSDRRAKATKMPARDSQRKSTKGR